MVLTWLLFEDLSVVQLKLANPMMNPGDNAVGWKRLACYLMDVFAMRDIELSTQHPSALLTPACAQPVHRLCLHLPM
jgi:hypothetical protein